MRIEFQKHAGLVHEAAPGHPRPNLWACVDRKSINPPAARLSPSRISALAGPPQLTLRYGLCRWGWMTPARPSRARRCSAHLAGHSVFRKSNTTTRSVGVQYSVTLRVCLSRKTRSRGNSWMLVVLTRGGRQGSEADARRICEGKFSRFARARARAKRAPLPSGCCLGAGR